MVDINFHLYMSDDFKIWYDSIDWETAAQSFEVPFSEPFPGYNSYLVVISQTPSQPSSSKSDVTQLTLF